MARERTVEELAEDVDRLTKQVQKLRNELANAPYVRHDVYVSDIRFHNAELGHVRDDLSGVRTQLQWVLGILALMFTSGVFLGVTTIVRALG